MSVRGHRRHDAPRLAVRVVTLDRVEGLESVPAAHHVEASVQHGNTELQPAPTHGGHLPPGVAAQAVLLDAGGACSREQDAVVIVSVKLAGHQASEHKYYGTTVYDIHSGQKSISLGSIDVEVLQTSESLSDCIFKSSIFKRLFRQFLSLLNN